MHMYTEHTVIFTEWLTLYSTFPFTKFLNAMIIKLYPKWVNKHNQLIYLHRTMYTCSHSIWQSTAWCSLDCFCQHLCNSCGKMVHEAVIPQFYEAEIFICHLTNCNRFASQEWDKSVYTWIQLHTGKLFFQNTYILAYFTTKFA